MNGRTIRYTKTTPYMKNKKNNLCILADEVLLLVIHEPANAGRVMAKLYSTRVTLQARQ